MDYEIVKISVLKSYSKLNIQLGVLGLYKSNLHKIESLVTFANIYDLIYISETKSKYHKVKFFGKFGKGIPKENTIFKLLKIIDNMKLLNGRKFSIRIKKKIPLKSGMGGGSMNAATILNFLMKKNYFRLSKKQANDLCFKVGNDVILGLSQNLKILKSNKKIINLKKKIKYFLVIIKPNFGCDTGKIFRKVKKFSKPKFNNKNLNYSKNLSFFKNDLENVAFKQYPVLSNIKKTLLNMPNIQFARMTGSGSSIVGYFATKKDSLAALKNIKKKYNNYWSIVAKTI